MSEKKDFILFGNTSLSDIFEEIHNNSSDNRTKINDMISTLIPLVKSLTDATIITPLLKDFVDVSVRNDAHLLKLADVVQKILKDDATTNPNDSTLLLSDAERDALMQEAEKLQDYKKSGKYNINDLETTVTKVTSDLNKG